MMNRKLADIVKGQKLVALAERETVQEACRYMWERRTGSVLVLDDQQRLTGIFTGRDAVRTLAEGKNAEVTTLGQAMTPSPIALTPDNRAIDALREMAIAASVIFRSSRAAGFWASFREVISGG